MKKALQSPVSDLSNLAVKAVSFQYMVICVIVSQIAVVFLSTKGSLFPGEERFTDIVGTCAEIIAGLYGITLAGYTFFLSRIDALTATDATLDYIVGSIKNRFKYLIWYITITVAATLFISVVLMYYPASSDLIPEFFYRLICNEFVIFLGFSVGLILYYSLKVIDPNCISKEAAKLKKRLSVKSSLSGSTVEFIALYDRIEALCNGVLPDTVLAQLHENKGKHFEYTLELLQEARPSLRPLLPELYRIHYYYECMVNCTPMQVSQEMCATAQRVIAVLEHPAHGLIKK